MYTFTSCVCMCVRNIKLGIDRVTLMVGHLECCSQSSGFDSWNGHYSYGWFIAVETSHGYYHLRIILCIVIIRSLNVQ